MRPARQGHKSRSCFPSRVAVLLFVLPFVESFAALLRPTGRRSTLALLRATARSAFRRRRRHLWHLSCHSGLSYRSAAGATRRHRYRRPLPLCALAAAAVREAPVARSPPALTPLHHGHSPLPRLSIQKLLRLFPGGFPFGRLCLTMTCPSPTFSELTRICPRHIFLFFTRGGKRVLRGVRAGGDSKDIARLVSLCTRDKEFHWGFLAR